jgi:hypothetical protein
MRGCYETLARRAAGASRGRPVAGGSWLGGRAPPQISQSVALAAPVDRSEATMSRLARALVLGATLAAMNLAGMTTVAQAHTNDQSAGNQDARRPPLERQVGESYRHRQVASQQQTASGDARRPPLERQVGESYRHQTRVPVRAAEASGQPGWLLASLGVLTAFLALSGGLAVLAAKRARRKAEVGQAA